MARVYVFADESGNFDFSKKRGASRYFILTTVTIPECAVGDELQKLRREMAWRGVGLASEFHASVDSQDVRNEVFGLLQAHHFRVDVTVLDKTKAQPQTRISDERFYQTAWFLHFKYVAPRIASLYDELLVVSSSLGTNKGRAAFHAAVSSVARQVSGSQCRVACWVCHSEPCLQVADYCCWAVQRKWESNDVRSYALIHDKIATEFEPFRFGKTVYY